MNSATANEKKFLLENFESGEYTGSKFLSLVMGGKKSEPRHGPVYFLDRFFSVFYLGESLFQYSSPGHFEPSSPFTTVIHRGRHRGHRSFSHADTLADPILIEHSEELASQLWGIHDA